MPRPDGDAAGAVEEAARKAEAFSQALMYACVSWVALVREEAAQSVDFTPTGQLAYEADVLLESGERLLLYVHALAALINAVLGAPPLQRAQVVF